MRIADTVYNEEQIRSFLYKADSSFFDTVTVFFNRVTELFKTFCWINSQEVFNAITDNREIIRVFDGIDTHLEDKIRSITQTVLEDDRRAKEKRVAEERFNSEVSEKIELVKKHAQKPNVYGSSNKEIFRIIELSYKNNLSREEKQFIHTYQNDVVSEIGQLNKALERHKELQALGINSELDDDKTYHDQHIDNLFYSLKSNIHRLLSDEERSGLNLSDDEKALLEVHHQPYNKDKLKKWLEVAKNPSALQTTDKTLRQKQEQALQIDEKIEGWRKIVVTKIDLTAVNANSPLALFNNPSLTSDDKLNIFQHFKYFENQEQWLTEYATKNDCDLISASDIDEEKLQKNIAFIRGLDSDAQNTLALYTKIFGEEEYARTYFIEKIEFFTIRSLASKASLTLREKRRLARLDINSLPAELEFINKALNRVSLLKSSGHVSITPLQFSRSVGAKNKDYLDTLITSSTFYHRLFPVLKMAMRQWILESREDFNDDQKRVIEILKTHRNLLNSENNETVCIKLFQAFEEKILDKSDFKHLILSTIVASNYSLNSPISNQDTYKLQSFLDRFVDHDKLKRAFKNPDTNKPPSLLLCGSFIASFYYGNTWGQKVTSGPYPAITAPLLIPVHEFYLSPQPKIPDWGIFGTLHPYFAGMLLDYILECCSN